MPQSFYETQREQICKKPRTIIDETILDEGPRPKSGKSRLNLNGTNLEGKSIRWNLNKKKLKRNLMIWRTKMQARVQGRCDLKACLKCWLGFYLFVLCCMVKWPSPFLQFVLEEGKQWHCLYFFSSIPSLCVSLVCWLISFLQILCAEELCGRNVRRGWTKGDGQRI